MPIVALVLLHGRPGRVQPHALRHPGGRERAGGRASTPEYSGFFFAMFFMAEYTGDVRRSPAVDLGAVPGRLVGRRIPMLQQHRLGIAIGLGPVWLIGQGLVPDVRDDVAALDAAPPARGPAHVRGLEGRCCRSRLALVVVRRRPGLWTPDRATASPGTAGSAGLLTPLLFGFLVWHDRGAPRWSRKRAVGRWPREAVAGATSGRASTPSWWG
mgnify:CR=1 FL=1